MIDLSTFFYAVKKINHEYRASTSAVYKLPLTYLHFVFRADLLPRKKKAPTKSQGKHLSDEPDAKAATGPTTTTRQPTPERHNERTHRKTNATTPEQEPQPEKPATPEQEPRTTNDEPPATATTNAQQQNETQKQRTAPDPKQAKKHERHTRQTPPKAKTKTRDPTTATPPRGHRR